MIPKAPFRSILLTALLLAGPATSAGRADSWVRVGMGGLGNRSRVQPDALAVHGGYVWVASAEALPAGGKRPHLFRAPLRDDTAWTEVTPPWSGNSEISALTPFAGDLYVGTTFGQVWRLRRGAWANVTPAWPGTNPIQHLVGWEPIAGSATLCAARGTVEVRCGLEVGVAEALPAVPLRNSRDIGAARLATLGDRLYLAVSGTTASSRQCEVLTYQRSRGWSSITGDCFGDTRLPWAGSMAAFRGNLYVGTGGHFGLPTVRRISYEGEVVDVTPTGIYPCTLVTSCPARYGAMAVSAGELFVGNRVTYAGGTISAEVVRTAGTGWSLSVERGFGIPTNDTTTALAGNDLLVYAAILNSVDGFEVWRRNFLLSEALRENLQVNREWLRHARLLADCLRVGPLPGCSDRASLAERFERVRLGFDTARHPADDPKLILATRQRYAQAGKELATGLSLASAGDAAARVDPKQARQYYVAAAQRIERAAQISSAAWDAVVAATKPKG